MSKFLKVAILTGAVCVPMMFGAGSAGAAPILQASASGFVYDLSVGANASFQQLSAATGPLVAEGNGGAVLSYYPNVSNSQFTVEGTVFAEAKARADYGVNGAALSVGLRNTNGTDRGAYPAGVLVGLPFNSTLQPNAGAFSSWTDSFVIIGGTGMGRASVNIALHGDAGREAGGTSGLADQQAFANFSSGGYGFVNYHLLVSYDQIPVGLELTEDGVIDPITGEFQGNPIGLELQFGQPLPASTPGFELNVVPDTLTGSFLFEYGVPFELQSYLDLQGYNWITIDYGHTAALSLFSLPGGASISSESGHVYPTSVNQPNSPPSEVPEPGTLILLGVGLAGIAALRRRLRKNRTA